MCDILIIYGSQTGQSQGICEEISSIMQNKKLQHNLYSMEEAAKKDLLNEMKTVIFVTSSTGDGDAPDNAVEFYKQVRNTSSLSHIRFALLGLGDSNYTTFLGFPKDFKKALEDKGAKSFYTSGWADDAVGLETVVDPWIEGLWPALHRHLRGEEFLETIELPEDMKPFGIINEEPQKQIEGIQKEVQLVDPKLTSITVGNLFEKKKPVEESVSTDSRQEGKHIEQADRPTIYFSSELRGRTLKAPALPREKFHVEFLENDVFVEFNAESLKQLPSAAGPLVNLPVSKARMLTSFDADKIAIEVTLDKTGNDIPCEPGDSIGIVCPNDPLEVSHILKRLEVEDVSNKVLRICGEARNIPSHFPDKASLKSLLLYHCDIRSSPKKALLRVMAEYAQNEDEKRRLLELSSVEGAVEYTKLIKEANISLLDILETFSSSRPPIEKVLHQLPKMLPRAYSIVTSNLKDPDHLEFVFKIVEFPATDGRTRERKGVATGWISQLTAPLWRPGNVEEKLEHLNLDSVQLPVYRRMRTAFRLPQQLDTPIIMVGPGSGVAPFLGFLHQREELIKSEPNQIVGASWLFFGCRHENKDYLYRSELERLHASGVLSRFYQAFSKEPPTGPRYVQDMLRLHKRSIVTLLLDKGAVFYVCGDAKGMAKDVFETMADTIAEVKRLDIQGARATIAKLQLEKRYLQDVWS